MTEEERKDYLKYIENYTINDLADEFNTQNFVIQDKDKFNEILLYCHFKQNEEIEQLQQENQKLKENYERIYNENYILREKHNINDIGLLDENYKLKQVIDKSIEYISSNDIEVLKYHDIPSETSSYEIVTVDLLKILKGGENNE